MREIQSDQMVQVIDAPPRSALSSIPDDDELEDEMPSLALTNSYSFASVSSTNLITPDSANESVGSSGHHHSNSQTFTNAASKFHFRNAVPVPFRSTNSSLLDMTRDESHDEEDCEVSPSLTLSPKPNQHTPEKSPAHVSLYEQTENSLMSISESLTGSFCAKPDPCLTDCTFSNISTGGRPLFSDGLVQRRLEEDIHYLLGSSILPCCEEKGLFQNCFFKNSDNNTEKEESAEKVRNRAGESWRARAYRIKRLREERMIEDGGINSYPSQRITQSYSVDALDNVHHNDTYGGISKKSENLKLRKPKQEINSDPLGRMIGDCIEPITRTSEEDEFEMVWKQKREIFDDQDLCYDSDPGEASFRMTVSETGAYVIMQEEETAKQGYNVKRCNSVTVGGISVIKGVGATKKPTSRRRRMHFDTLCDVNGNDHMDDNGTGQMSQSEGLHTNQNMWGRHPEELTFDDSEDDFVDTYEDTEDIANGPGNFGSSKINEHSDVVSKVQVRWRCMTYSKIHTPAQLLTHIFSVQSSLNETWTLTWHPAASTLQTYAQATKSKKQKSLLNLPAQSSVPDARVQTPRCIQLWFERGNRIRKNDIVEPKLMWRDAFHPDLVSQRKLNESSTKRPYQLCLLTICRILEATEKIDRKKYPFAKISCSFLIRTCDDDEYLFEAINEEERDSLVYLWKLVVARLASQAVVGDGDGMVGEFFVPTSFGVPG